MADNGQTANQTSDWKIPWQTENSKFRTKAKGTHCFEDSIDSFENRIQR